MPGGKRRDMRSDLAHHPGIGLPRHVLAAEMLGQRHHAERDRHPGLDARDGVLLAGIAFDSHQFGRAAADIEQDRAPPVRIEQRRTADHGERGFRLAVDDFEMDAGFGGDPVAKAFRICRRAAGLGRDHPQARRLFRPDLVAANPQGRDRALDGGLADTAARRNALAQPDDARKRIDDAEAVAARAGDQQAAIVGAKIERRVNPLGRGRRPNLARRAGGCRRSQPLQISARPRAGAEPRLVTHQKCLSAATGQNRITRAHEEFPFTESLAARAAGATAVRRPCRIRRHRRVIGDKSR